MSDGKMWAALIARTGGGVESRRVRGRPAKSSGRLRQYHWLLGTPMTWEQCQQHYVSGRAWQGGLNKSALGCKGGVIRWAREMATEINQTDVRNRAD